MNKITIVCILMLIFHISMAQQTVVEQSNFTQTATYEQTIAFYKALDKKSKQVLVKECGPTDAGLPLHIVEVKSNKLINKKTFSGKQVRILINNGIHPGEPDGIDASMMLVRDIVQQKISLPQQVVLYIIPVYNIGGTLNRSAYYRADQNGPDEFGFRGNSQNLDLNRDFIKCDSKEAKSFAKIFHSIQPHIFIDNHVSNGADYKHVMTLLTTEYNKLGGPLGQYLHETFEPLIYKEMKNANYDLIPYVNFFGDNPVNGWPAFYDSPRYSSGYSSLWHTLAFVPETHMLKSYKERVLSTYKLMEVFIKVAKLEQKNILEKYQQQIIQYNKSTKVPIDWILDKTRADSIIFKGYEAAKKDSKISGLPRLFYDQTRPYTKKIPFYNTYKPNIEVTKPQAYIIPQGWWRVIELLEINNIAIQRFKKDTIITVEAYTILETKSSATQYEHHHANYNTKVETKIKSIKFRKGDVMISTNQLGGRFLVETLEPHARDSYFSWNFFDAILGQKEGFSDYAFEEIALKILEENPGIKEKLEDKKKMDEKFRNDTYAQLEFIYKQSPYYEPAHMQYPVYRYMGTTN